MKFFVTGTVETVLSGDGEERAHVILDEPVPRVSVSAEQIAVLPTPADIERMQRR